MHPFASKTWRLRFFVAEPLGKSVDFANKPGYPVHAQN
jgi:hypothetical protein